MPQNFQPYTGLHGVETEPLVRPFSAERAEAEWMFDWLNGAPEPAKSLLGTSAIRLGGGVVTSMKNDPVSYWSKALGFDRAIDASTIGAIVDFYRLSGTASATIQIAPDLLPPNWQVICREFGLTAGPSWVKLAGSSDVAVELPTDLRVDAVGPNDLTAWADVVFRGFGMPAGHLSSIAAASAGRGAIQAFGVWHNSTLVAGASLAIVDGVGALLGAATLPEYRGRGAQSALIAVRAQSARRAGVDRVVAETGVPTTEGANPSLNNLLRAGLVPLYERANWQWTNPDLTTSP